MDNYTIDKNIRTICVTADSFPDGIEEAHQKLHAMLTPIDRRQFFGISWPGTDGEMIYKAAASEMQTGEAEHLHAETFTIKEGPYNSFYITDYRENLDSIGKAFDLLTAEHETDPNGYCLEWYINEKDVKCLVPLRTKEEDL